MQEEIHLHHELGEVQEGRFSSEGWREIIAAFQHMKVAKCGATHCTGDVQIGMFKEAFGDNYVPMGTGRVIEIPGP